MSYICDTCTGYLSIWNLNGSIAKLKRTPQNKNTLLFMCLYNKIYSPNLNTITHSLYFQCSTSQTQFHLKQLLVLAVRSPGK